MISIQRFGTLPNGEVVQAYTLRAENGMQATFLSYGATLQSLCLADGRDIVLGFDDIEGYLKPHPYIGAAIGRVSNRIARGSFSIDGKTYHVEKNEGDNSLHGGPKGFDKINWKSDIDGKSIIFHHTSPSGHQGYPGEVTVEFRYTLDNEGLRIDMRVQTDVATAISLTAHSYFNLGEGPITNHALSLKASHFYPTDQEGINHGQSEEIPESIFDFRASRDIGQTKIDHHFNVDGTGIREMATLFSPGGETRLKVLSDLPGFQLYTAYNMDDLIGKKSKTYGHYAGIAIEPQYPPNAVNLPDFPDVILRPDQIWAHSILYKVETLEAA